LGEDAVVFGKSGQNFEGKRCGIIKKEPAAEKVTKGREEG